MAAQRNRTQPQKSEGGCGCLLFILLAIGVGGYWLLPRIGRVDIDTARDGDFAGVIEQLMTEPETPAIAAQQPIPAPTPPAVNAPVAVSPTPSQPASSSTPATPTPVVSTAAPAAAPSPALPAAWQAKETRGIYISRYQITNRASEQMIRDRVRYYKSQGINTIIHGVWGNGCTMYKSDVMKNTLGYSSCPNLFQDGWLDWLIDEAHRQGMEVHAYFEKGIKLDERSPIFDIATQKGWFVPGIDKTYPSVDHYVLDVEKPEVAKYFTEISAEFVRRYPTIDAVQWDDYVGYHEELPGEKEKDRTAALTVFMRSLRSAVKQSNPDVSFDVCHHNPYWGKRYFDADWANWNVDRAFIQVYNDNNFAEEMGYVQQHAGIAIADNQFNRLSELASNPNVKSVLLFPSAGNPEETAAKFKAHWSNQ